MIYVMFVIVCWLTFALARLSCYIPANLGTWNGSTYISESMTDIVEILTANLGLSSPQRDRRHCSQAIVFIGTDKPKLKVKMPCMQYQIMMSRKDFLKSHVLS